MLTIASAKLHGDALDGTADGRVSLADGSIALNLGVDALSAALPAAARGVLAERTKLLAAINRDAKGNLAVDLTTHTKAGKKKVVALVGVENLVVVETDDALLVIPRDRAQDVRAAVDALKARDAKELL